MMRSVDLKFLAVVAVAVVSMAIGVHLLHGYQTRRNAGTLLIQAERAEEAGQLSEATWFLDRYLRFVPADAGALLKLGMLSAQNAEKQKSAKEALEAFFVLNRVLGLDRGNHQARRKVVDLAMGIERYDDARAHLKVLLKDPNFQNGKKQAELRHLYALCYKRDRDYQQAADWFKQARECDPAMLAAYQEEMLLYRSHKLNVPAKADQLMDHMVQSNKNSLDALVIHAAYLIDYARVDYARGEKGRLSKAVEDIKRAGALAPKDVRLVLLAGNLELALGENSGATKKEEIEEQKAAARVKARAIFEQGLKDHPRHPAIYVNLAALDAREGEVDKGLQLLRQGLVVMPNQSDILTELVDLLVQKRELTEALEVIQKKLPADYPGPLKNYLAARVQIARGEFGQASELLEAVREPLLDYPAVLKSVDLLRGYCFEQLGNPDQALRAYQDAAHHDPMYDPKRGEANPRLKVAQTYFSLDRLDEALREFSQISTFKEAPLGINLAIVRLMMMRNLRQPSLRRDWGAVKERLADVEKKLPREVEALLKADLLLLQDAKNKDVETKNKERARQLLNDAKRDRPDQVEPWIALAVLAGRDKSQDALAILDEAARQPAFKGNPKLLRARLRFLAQGPDAVKALKAEELKIQGEDRPQMLQALAKAYYIAELLLLQVEVVLLKADLLLLQDAKNKDEETKNKERARQLLNDAKRDKPDRVEPWIALAVLAGRDKSQDALPILDEAARQPAFKGNPKLLRARLRFLAQGPDAVKAVKAEEPEVLKVKGPDRPELLNALALAYYIAQDKAAAARAWQVLANEHPGKLALRLMLFDLALPAEDETEPTPAVIDWTESLQRLKDIRKLEGKTAGSYWRYAEAALAFTRAKKEGKNRSQETRRSLSQETRRSLAQAHQYLSEAGKTRPSWFRVLALEGLINDLEADDAELSRQHAIAEGRREGAVAKLQAAVNLGDRRPGIIRRLAELLRERNRYDDVQKVISKLIDQQQTLISSGLGQFVTESLLRDDVEQALRIAEKSIDSKNYKDHVWFGDILRAVKKYDQARAELTRACELAPAQPPPWISLVRLLVDMRDKTEAENTIARAVKSLPAGEAPLALAHCYDALDNAKLAEKYFADAYRNKPGDMKVLEAIARFYSRREEYDKAEKYWDMIEKNTTKSGERPELLREARRKLAVSLGLGPDYQRFQDAMKLLEKNRNDKSDLRDLEVKAALLSTRLNHWLDAIRVFEEINLQQPLPAKHRFTLARLYYAVENQYKNQYKVDFHMRTLLGSADKKSPDHYAFYVRVLLERDPPDLPSAEVWAANLEKAHPGDLNTGEIKARVLHAQGKDDQALAQLRALALRPDVDTGKVAAVVEELGRKPKSKKAYSLLAEELYRAKVRQASDQASLLALARFFDRSARFTEAFECCEQALAKGSPEPVLELAVSILHHGDAGTKHGRQVEDWLQEKLKSTPDSVSLLSALAELRDWQGQFSEAVRVYRRLLERSPKKLVPLNNLAWLLAHQGEEKEAAEVIETALKAFGRLPQLLDTKGMIYLILGKPAEAVKEFEESMAVKKTPVRLCHLAEALYQAGRPRDAGATLDEAKGLTVEQLHPLERDRYQNLLKGLNRRKIAQSPSLN
jgi:tetratricopeptide (TPR) repeat protein